MGTGVYSTEGLSLQVPTDLGLEQLESQIYHRKLKDWGRYGFPGPSALISELLQSQKGQVGGLFFETFKNRDVFEEPPGMDPRRVSKNRPPTWP